MKIPTDPFVFARGTVSGKARCVGLIALAGLALLTACGASDAPVSPVDQGPAPATGVSQPVAYPVANPVAAGTHLFDPLQGQPIPALTPRSTGFTGAAGPSEAGAAPLIGAAPALGLTPSADPGADPALRAKGTPARPLPDPTTASVTAATILVLPGLAIERDPTGRSRLDRSSRP